MTAREIPRHAGDSSLPVPRARVSHVPVAKPLEIERTWTTDREAMLAALRVVIGLPRVLPDPRSGGEL